VAACRPGKRHAAFLLRRAYHARRLLRASVGTKSIGSLSWTVVAVDLFALDTGARSCSRRTVLSTAGAWVNFAQKVRFRCDCDSSRFDIVAE